MKSTIQFEPTLSNFLDESFSNATDTVGAVAEGVGALANLGKAGIENKGKKLDILLDTGCVKPRGIGKKRKLAEQKYQACLQNNKERILYDKIHERQSVNKYMSDSNKSKVLEKKVESEQKTNRIKYIIGGLVVVASIIGFIAYKKLKK